MTIVGRREDKYGALWAYDDKDGWLPLDKTAEQGSFAGNVMRGAGQGMSQIGQGIEQLVLPDTPQAIAAREGLQTEIEAAQRSAPWATGLGNITPDIAAGLGLAVATGGLGPAALMGSGARTAAMGPLATMGAEAALGGALQGIRPGSMEERAANAGLGAIAGAAGGGLSVAATRGIQQGLKAGEWITGRTASRIAAEIDAGEQRVASARALAGEGVEGGAPRAGAGAAATPEGELGDEFLTENQILQRTEDTGADVSATRADSVMRQRAESLGYKSPMGAGTRSGAPARMLAAVEEVSPLAGTSNQIIRTQNQATIAAKLSDALGIGRDASGKPLQSIRQIDLAENEARLGNEFQRVEQRLQPVNTADYVRELQTISQTKGLAGKSGAQRVVNDMIDGAESHGAKVTGEELMRDRSKLTSQMADFFNAGDTSSGEAMMGVVNKLDGLIERELKKRGMSRLAAHWQATRRQWQLQTMATAGKSVSDTGDVNVKSLYNRMLRKRSSGGYGIQGPDADHPARELFDILRVAAGDETQVPMTGVRAAMQNATVRRAAGYGAGAAGLGALTIWDD